MKKMAMPELHSSARASDRILKVARTSADVAVSESIQAGPVGEANRRQTLEVLRQPLETPAAPSPAPRAP